MYSENYKALQILPPVMTAQVFVVFEIGRFMIFSNNFREFQIKFFSRTLRTLTLHLGAIKVLSGVANLDFKYECSNPCSL